MQLINIQIDRIIIHQIYPRDVNGEIVIPSRSSEYTNFDDAAMEAFKRRLLDALGEDSKAVPMQIFQQSAGYVPDLVNTVIGMNDEDFSVSSYDFATKLAEAQNKKNIPGGILVVFSGSYGNSNKSFLGLIKAEIHSGYERFDSAEGKIGLRFIEDLLLTPTSRLYKTAAFFERDEFPDNFEDLNEKWSVFISDYQIGKADGKAAAQYFYSGFLGCCYPETSARTTKNFYDSAKKFISNMDVPEENKSEFYNALNIYLKLDNTGSISSSDFAERYFDTDTQDLFSDYMQTQGVPTSAFTKDIEHIESFLKKRRVSFRKNVTITASTEAFESLIEMSSIDGLPDSNGQVQRWTKVIIKDQISEQS
ncbi:nucleoid-associated protein [Pokkaliibacter sp. CJK22405]|uniref:nucleoid-associated protein n=1 Tax=Pokkaliibacter sp. CJK22405 TaxID=3384615 RepID=UPI0039854C4B